MVDWRDVFLLFAVMLVIGLAIVSSRWRISRTRSLRERAPEIWHKYGRPNRYQNTLAQVFKLAKLHLRAHYDRSIPEDLARDLRVSTWLGVAQLVAVAALLAVLIIGFEL